jgi:hypothetical protein
MKGNIMTKVVAYVRERHGYRFLKAEDHPELVRLAGPNDIIEIIEEDQKEE